MNDFNPLLTMEACVFVKSSIPSMSKWKDVCLVLMPDSTLGWYKINRKLTGSVKLSSVCKYMCVGHMAKTFAKAPKLPRDADLNQLLGVPMMCEPMPDKMHWFCFDHVKHLIKFLQALEKLLAPSKPSSAVEKSPAVDIVPSAPPPASPARQRQPPPTYDEVATSAKPSDTGSDDKRKALLTAGGLLATGLLLGPDAGWSWGYGWAGASGPLFQDIDERELIGYCLPARGLRGIAGPSGCGSRASIHRYNRAYQRFNSDLGNDLDRWEEDQDRRAARRRSDAVAAEATTAEDLGASLAAVSAAAAAAAGAEHCAGSLQDFYDIGDGAGYNDVENFAYESGAGQLSTNAAATADVDDEDFSGESACRGACPPGTELTSVADYHDKDDADNAAEAAAMAAAEAAVGSDDEDQLTMAGLSTCRGGGFDDRDQIDECCQDFDDCHLEHSAAVMDDEDALARDRCADDEDLQLYVAEHADVSDGHCQGDCGGDLYDCRDAEFDLRDEEDLAERELAEAEEDRYGDGDGYGDGYGYGDDGFGGFGRDEDF